MITGEGTRLGVAAARRLAELDRPEIGPGLTEAEFDRVEREFGFRFADDHRAFLSVGLPLNGPVAEGQAGERPWPDWRDGDRDELREHLDWPVDCLLWDVRHGHWRESWGERPEDTEAAVAAARLCLAEAPRMTPVYAHRFLPAGAGTCGHPVLSMRGGDIIYCGVDLLDYVNQEFAEPRPDRPAGWPPHLTVPFWSDYLRPRYRS
ncbi:SMI1/KNR4 family protein [Streptoalloteichus hindustanus]|uniref:SMI1/KNR4 family protein n=1 Tax=Streptoalloteichus hindustanus TaxID=2017 RepID=UPI0009357BB5|nr:SMI1/KNR4 family protein [Streptoalloteichus hindustanus]